MEKLSKLSRVSSRRVLFVSLLVVGISIFSSMRIKAIIIPTNPPSYSSLTPHDPISITSDSGFEVFPGSGTEEDPYVIEGYSITKTSNRGISITDTTKYFIVRNCYVDIEGHGICIYNAADGTAIVINNTCDNCWNGIRLSNSCSSTVVNNTCNNSWDGIELWHSGSSTVANNTCNNNGYGIALWSSRSVIVANNTCINNDDLGIELWDSGSSTVANNIFTNCGLYIQEDTLDAYLSYTIENNWVNGKKLGFYANLDSTIIVEPIYGQLIFVNCTNVTVRDQILNDATTGLSLYYCTYSVIISNTCSNNWEGIRLYNSGSSTVANNTCINNNYGIWLQSSGSSTVINNKCNNNDYGIKFSSSGSSAIINNTCNNNEWEGIAFSSSGSSVVINNKCNNNDYGIKFSSSGSSMVANNMCNNNNNGFYLHNSGSSTIIDNMLENNNNYGIWFFYASGSSTVVNNTFTNCGLYIQEDTLDTYLSYTVENNWVNGKKLGFYANLDSTIIAEPVYGQLILVNCTNVTVRDQILNYTATGLSLYYCTYSIIINNTCSNNDYYGIRLSNSGNSTVASNTCSNNKYGILLDFSISCAVTNNMCKNNDNGIRLYSSESSTVINNTCSNSYRHGIWLEDSDWCVVTYNLLQENERYGVYLRYDSNNNTIHHNTFVDNNPADISQAYDDGRTNTWYDTETLEGNYWSDWNGTSSFSGSYSIYGKANSVDLYPLDEPAEYSTDETQVFFTFTLLIFAFPLLLTVIISRKRLKTA